MVYEPREDSWLLLEVIRGMKARRTLDMGTGTGILAAELVKNCEEVVAADIDFAALKVAQKNTKSQNIKFIQSDLFEKIPGKFDLIVFNPPYLPPEQKGDLAYSGGKPLILKFLDQAKVHLEPQGKIILLWSSLTRLFPFEIKGYTVKRLREKKLFMERLWVYELKLLK